MSADVIDVPQIQALQVRLVPIEQLTRYARNAKKHSPEQITLIARSMMEFGWTNPCLIDGDNGLLAGHGRLEAAEKLKIKQIPCIDLSHLNDAQKRAYILADNQIANFGTSWDMDLLVGELQDLQTDGFDLSLTGFSSDELAELLADEITNENDPDVVPDVPEEPHSKLGDMWLLGPHRVRCGDSTKPEDWAALMQGELADCVWTDPPYNVAYESKLAGSIKNDDMSDGNFHQFLLDFYSGVISVMKSGAPIYVAHADTEGLNFRSAFIKAGFKLSGCLIWKKNSLVLGRSDFQWMHEPILYGWKPGSSHKWYGGRKQVTVQELGSGSPFQQMEDGRWALQVGDAVMYVTGDVAVEQSPASVIHCDKPKRSAAHPTMKPTALISKMLGYSARPKDIVVDGFGGSGSTLMAAEVMGMTARLMEFDPRFVDVIAVRYFLHSGRVPVHAVTGEPFPQDVIDRLAATCAV